MNLALDVLSNCKVRVLLVPVPPIKKATFYKYVELVKTFNVVRLGDVTPDLKKGANAMFSSQVFQEGQMHFQFLTHWTREHAELEDFQPHRRIFGVIGIMDCQEWKNKDLNEAYKQFEQNLDKYPTAIATRCFAFDPSETQEDDTKGLIMMPNVGNMSFYMSTMICDFSSEILEQFAILANRIEKLQLLESPLPTTIQIPRREPQQQQQQQQQQRYSQSISSSSNSSSTVSKRSSYQPSSPASRPENHHHRFSTNTIHLAGTTGESIRTRKRTPGRIRKLLGDFYLLAGRLPDAVNHYDQAIEMAKITSDFLWIAGAMEGLVCATILLEYLQADIGHIVSRPTAPSSPEEDGEEVGEPEPEPKGSLNMVMDQYAKIIGYYSKVFLTANFGVPDLVYAEACLKMARVLTTAYLNNGWNDKTVQLLLQGKLHDKKIQHDEKDMFVSSKDLIAYKASGIPRFQIAEYVTKIWEININQLVLLDQIYVTTAMSTIYSSIGYHRKAAWLMHEGVERMLPLLIQHRRSKESTKMATHDNGVLETLKRICEIYGIGERNVHDGGALQAIQSQQDHYEPTHQTSSTNPKVGTKDTRFGWPEIQIDILKQCISVSEALLDNDARLYYTTVLLKNLYKYIPKADQIKLAAAIQSMVVSKEKRTTTTTTDTINYWGVNIVSRIEAKRPISRKAVYAHPIKNENIKKPETPTNDPFIYNPFAKKETAEFKVVLIKNEVSEFKVTLVNPFGFDLELQSIALSTSGIAFNSTPTALTIPANATVHVPLTGVPEETGTLIIRGCLIQIIGFVEQEFLVDSSVKTQDTLSDDFKKIKQSGLEAIKATRKREMSGGSASLNFYTLNVIEDQPLLKIKTTSLQHGAVMLFEGEVTHIDMELENIGHIPVDFITLSFVDSTTTNTFINPELPPEEQYEMELYTKGTRVFSWEGTTERSNGFVGKQIWLPPGSTTSIQVNIYGKRDCQGGTIQVDYGYLDRTVQEMMQEETAAMFYTRQLYLNVLITVYQNLEPCNWDIVYLRHSTPASKEQLDAALEKVRTQKTSDSIVMSRQQPVEDLLLLTRNTKLENQDRNEYCLVLFDVKNTWTMPFDIDITVDQLESGITVQPGSTARIVLPIKRLFLPPETCKQEIPSFDPNKQFVVGPKISEEQQHARLQTFWYRQELLSRIKAVWSCQTTKRSGQLNLRSSLRLTPMQLGILKKEDVEFIVDLTGKSVEKKSHRRFSCVCNDYVMMTVSIKNRFSHPIKIILRIQPVQSYNDGVKEYDLSDKLLMEGVQQVVMPEIPATDGVVSHSFPLYFLSRGQFELLYHAEDVHSRNIYYDQEWTVVDVAEEP